MSTIPADDNRPASPGVAEPGWQVRTGLTLSQAELLLDHLEGCGVTCREMRFEGGGVTVRWQLPWPMNASEEA
jgi:hypothetical protein